MMNDWTINIQNKTKQNITHTQNRTRKRMHKLEQEIQISSLEMTRLEGCDWQNGMAPYIGIFAEC